MTAPVLDKSARVQIDDPLNIYIEQDSAKTDAQLAASKARIDAGQAASEIDGWTVAVKDNYCTEDYRTTAASKILEDFQPTYESTVTSKLRAAGGVVNGKVNMDEFAMGSSTETSHFGPTLNPVAKALGLSDRVPGGSSGALLRLSPPAWPMLRLAVIPGGRSASQQRSVAWWVINRLTAYAHAGA